MNNNENDSLLKSIKNIKECSNIKQIIFKEIDYNDLKEKTEEGKKKQNKSSKKKRKKKKKILKQIESKKIELIKENIFNSNEIKPKNIYRVFLLYKLKKKYDAKINTYNIKKVNELIFNVPSHFTALFKEYLLKEEEAEFLKRIYWKNEIWKKLKNIFYFYDKYSKIFPNYIVIPEGHHFYKNILKKQKMIDKLQKIKEEEMKNKQILLEGSFNTVFSNGAIDSIYNNKDSFALTSLLSSENNEKNEYDEILSIENIINTIEKYENKNIEIIDKKQIIYKKEFKGIRSLSKSTRIVQNGCEIKENGVINNVENENKIIKSKNKKINHIKKNIMTNNKKLVKYTDKDNIDIETESENEEEEERKIQNINEKLDIINDCNKKSIENNEYNRNKYKKIKTNKITQNYEINNEEDANLNKNKKKKFIILRGNRHYFIKNTEKDEKSMENKYSIYDNKDKNLILKKKQYIENDNNIFDLKMKDYKNNNSLSQNKNLSKDYLSRNNKNLILYKKKLCNDTRGMSISKKNNDLENNDKVLHKVRTNYTINGSKIVKIRKYFINEQKTITINTIDKNDNLYLNYENDDIFLNFNNNQNINKNYYKTITYSKSNFDLNEQNKNNFSINGNVYYKKHKIDNLRNSYGEKSCPKHYGNKFLTDMHKEIRKKQIINSNSKENRDKKENYNEDITNVQSHRYYRINQFNNKKFRLKAPKNYIN